MKTAVTALLALLLHLLLGWAWTIAAGVVGGAWAGRRGWLVGMAGVGLDWLALILYSFWVDARAVGTMAATMGAILGNMPSWAFVAMTLAIGLLLGGLGGIIGSRLTVVHNRYFHEGSGALEHLNSKHGLHEGSD